MWNSTNGCCGGAVSFAGAALLSALVLLSTIAVAFSAARFERKLVHLARRDPLTDLRQSPCRRREARSLVHGAGRRAQLRAARRYLDRFKFVNDTYGHAVGDELLRFVASRLNELVGRDDLVARLGGDEFAVIQPVERFTDDAAALARRVCRDLSKPYEIGSINAIVGASVGIASAASDGAATSELLNAADMALYSAKSKGRGSFCFFHSDMHQAVQDKVVIENGLRFAIERDELRVFYQPIKCARSEETVGFEALLRWRRPACPISRRRVHPDRRGNRPHRAIGAWVLERACADIARTSAIMRVAVNCSPVSSNRPMSPPSCGSAWRSLVLPPTGWKSRSRNRS